MEQIMSTKRMKNINVHRKNHDYREHKNLGHGTNQNSIESKAYSMEQITDTNMEQKVSIRKIIQLQRETNIWAAENQEYTRNKS
jgi:hypothetical protein